MKAETSAESSGNNLLRELRCKDFEALAPHLKEIQAESGAVFHEPGARVKFAYFPCGTSLAAFTIPLQEGDAVETALIGREGAVGGIVSHEQLPAYARASVVLPGVFLAIRTAELQRARLRSPDLNKLLARYADCLLAQLFQCAACNACHSIEQRTAKWLLSVLDRTETAEITLTQEHLASMIGVGRSYMGRVLRGLKAQGALETRRGNFRVADPAKLRELCCSCPDAVRHHFDSVLKGVYPDYSH